MKTWILIFILCLGLPIENNNPCKCSNHCESSTTEKTIVPTTQSSTPIPDIPSTIQSVTAGSDDVDVKTPSAAPSTMPEVLPKPRIATIPMKTKRAPVKSSGNVVRNMKKPNRNKNDKDSKRTNEGSSNKSDRLPGTVNSATMTKTVVGSTVMRNGKLVTTRKPMTAIAVTSARGKSNSTTAPALASTISASTTVTKESSSGESTLKTPTQTSTVIVTTSTQKSTPTKVTSSVTPTTSKSVVITTTSTTTKPLGDVTSPTVKTSTTMSPITTAKPLVSTTTTVKTPQTTVKPSAITPSAMTSTTIKAQSTTTIKAQSTTTIKAQSNTTIKALSTTTTMTSKPLTPYTTPVVDLIMEANRQKKIASGNEKKTDSD